MSRNCVSFATDCASTLARRVQRGVAIRSEGPLHILSTEWTIGTCLVR